jgi:hypothetical protein
MLLVVFRVMRVDRLVVLQLELRPFTMVVSFLLRFSDA